jgi:hypothetical protein
MPNFFQHNCQIATKYCQVNGHRLCLEIINEHRFGIIDDNTEEDEPAYVQRYAEEDWNVTVEKASNDYAVLFKAIDKCLDFPPPPHPNIENNRCDAMLHFPGHLYFIEIKYAEAPNYDKTINQLSRTIHVFKNSHPVELEACANREAYIANALRPKAPEIGQTEKDKFADNNLDFELFRSTRINLP